MVATLSVLARLRQLGHAMNPGATRAGLDQALPALRQLLEAAGVPYKLAGGLAVIHHGHPRFTEDVDVLVEAAALEGLDGHLGAAGFTREAHDRLRHVSTGVRVDLLVSGEPMPGPGRPCYPRPADVAGSPSDATVVALAPLLELKLHAGRHQDRADIVALLKPVDDTRYVALEAAMPAALRSTLAALRRDALEELSWTAGR